MLRATSKQMEHDLSHLTSNIFPMAFSDHHVFLRKDIERINEKFNSLPSPKIIITTEKDATRLEGVEGLSDEIRQHLYVLPIHISLLLDQAEAFKNKIYSYVRKNSRNSILAKRKDEHKSQDSNNIGDRPRTISFRNN